jgi:osmotically-inducible protein OsmY
VKDATTAGSAAVQTAEVKAALVADSRVDAAGIDVDTDDREKTVTLKGHVPSAAQKLAAGQIARDKAEGYEIRNDLAVRP